jgi:hypothetical protein
MMKPKFNYFLSVVLLFVLIFSGVFFFAFLTQYIEAGTNFFQDLSVILSRRCSGSLTLSSSGEGTCLVKAKVLTSGCKGKTYKISEGSCFGPTKCYGMVGYESFQAACVWSTPHGDYSYSLCIDNKREDSKSISC